MVGYVPVLVEIDAKAMAWIEFESMANFEAVLDLSGEVKYRQSFTLDLGRKEFQNTEASLSVQPISVDSLTVDGSFNAEASMRIGPRLIFSVFKVGGEFDLAARVDGNTELIGSLDGTSGEACVSGSANLNVGVDARVSASLPDVVDIIQGSCDQAVGAMGMSLDAANFFIDNGQCVADVFDVDSKNVNYLQSEIEEAMKHVEDNLCKEACASIPASVRTINAKAQTFGTGDWIDILTYPLFSIEKGMCGNVDLIDGRGPSGGGMAKHPPSTPRITAPPVTNAPVTSPKKTPSPSQFPSTRPTLQWSMKPSIFTSVQPSSAPSSGYCDFESNLRNQTLFVPIVKHCWKINMTESALILGDWRDADCSNYRGENKRARPHYRKIGEFDYGSGHTVHFKKLSNPKPVVNITKQSIPMERRHGWSGTIEFLKGNYTTPTEIARKMHHRKRHFKIQIGLGAC